MFDLIRCLISRRGKAAKGTIEVTTLGVPDVVDDNGIVKSWDYSRFASVDTAEFAMFCEQFGNVNIAMAMGIDQLRKSSSMKQQNEVSMLAARVLADKDFAVNAEDAVNIAKTLLQTRRNLLNCGVSEDADFVSLDFLFAQRKAKVLKDRKAAGKLPKLVKTAKVQPVAIEPELDDIDVPEDDSDDDMMDSE